MAFILLTNRKLSDLGTYGATPSAGLIVPRNVPGEEDSANYIGQTMANGQVITEPGHPVRAESDPITSRIVALYPGEERVAKQQLVQLPSGQFGYARYNQLGAPIDTLTTDPSTGAAIVPPSGFVPRVTTRTGETMGEVTDADGNIHKVKIPLSSQSSQNRPGPYGSGSLPPIPTLNGTPATPATPTQPPAPALKGGLRTANTQAPATPPLAFRRALRTWGLLHLKLRQPGRISLLLRPRRAWRILKLPWI